jgi:uncharacterized membrane protein YfcA
VSLPLWGRYGETHILLIKEHIRMTTTPPETPATPAKPTAILSILSLVAGLISFVCCGGLLFGAAAIILGVLGRKRENSKGLALAGIILGAVGAVTGTIFIILWTVGLVALPGATTYTTY